MRVQRRKSKSLIITDHRMGKVTRVSSSWRPPGYRQRRRVISAVIAVFVVVAIVSGIWGIAMIITDIMRPETDEEEQQPAVLLEVDEEASKFDDRDALDILVIKVSDDKSKPEYCMLMRLEPSEERVYITDILTSLQIGDRTLAGWYREYGVEVMAEKLTGFLECDRVSTVLITYNQIRLLLNDFGGVEYRIPYSIIYKSPSGSGDRDLNIAAGTRVYTGGETARLLNYPDWKGGEAEHRKMYCEVLAAFVSQLLAPDKTDTLNGTYLKLVSGTSFDLSRTEFQRALAGLEYLSKSNSGSLTMFVDIEKQSNEDGSSGYSEQQLELLRAVFGSRDADKSD